MMQPCILIRFRKENSDKWDRSMLTLYQSVRWYSVSMDTEEWLLSNLHCTWCCFTKLPHSHILIFLLHLDVWWEMMYLQKLELLIMSCTEQINDTVELWKCSCSCAGDFVMWNLTDFWGRKWLIERDTSTSILWYVAHMAKVTMD